ncbi:MAG: hypothetical protein L6R40_005770 [Gallowayella cf. fulva]|nr:MAG: hypothetical protein L6R40_005770 [Xanthomendoza cf. fulva]
MFSPLLFCFVSGLAIQDETAPARRGSPTIRCEQGVCILKTTDTGFELSRELLDKHIGPDVIVVIQKEYHGEALSTGKGAIIVKDTQGVYANKNSVFVQNIRSSQDDTVLAIAIVDPLVPDPDMFLASVAQDAIMAGIPTDLRPLKAATRRNVL